MIPPKSMPNTPLSNLLMRNHDAFSNASHDDLNDFLGVIINEGTNARGNPLTLMVIKNLSDYFSESQRNRGMEAEWNENPAESGVRTQGHPRYHIEECHECGKAFTLEIDKGVYSSHVNWACGDCHDDIDIILSD